MEKARKNLLFQNQESFESESNTVNANGRRLLEFCKLHTLGIANGRTGADKWGGGAGPGNVLIVVVQVAALLIMPLAILTCWIS